MNYRIWKSVMGFNQHKPDSMLCLSLTLYAVSAAFDERVDLHFALFISGGGVVE